MSCRLLVKIRLWHNVSGRNRYLAKWKYSNCKTLILPFSILWRIWVETVLTSRILYALACFVTKANSYIQFVKSLDCISFIYLTLFTRSHFWPAGIVVTCGRLSVCSYVGVRVKPELIRTITHDPFKLGSPNLEQRYKAPCYDIYFIFIHLSIVI